MSDQDTENWYSPESATFGDRLAAARDKTGMSQAELAKRLGVKKSTMSAWEQDLSEPRANRLSMMAGLLNVSITWLLMGEGEGIDAPNEDVSISHDMKGLLTDIRDVRTQISQASDRLGRLEKRLRSMLTENAQ